MLLVSLNNFGQTKFKIKEVETKNWKSIYYLVNEKGETIKELDTAKYVISLNDAKYKYFAVFMIKGEKGWSAIDINEKILFKVYNTSFGEPSPDEIIDNKIRIVDENDKIGFADYKGNIIINPKFEIASSFYKGKAIIGESCEKKPWELAEEVNHSDCHHYSIECKKYGYINDTGEILEIGDYKVEELQNKIKWKAPE
jgi:hypothetical protein